MSRPFTPRPSPSSQSFVRVNGKIRAREVRVIGAEGQQLGVFSLGDAINMARNAGVDLVEIAPNATPPVCRIVDYGKYRYEQAKKEKDAKKHQHANKVKEIQLSANIDPHDLGVKLAHAIDFLCDDMKVKVTLRFRGREMAHKEFGFEVVKKFIAESAPYGHEDAPPKLVGRSINVMLSPLPRNKRAKNPHEGQELPEDRHVIEDDDDDDDTEGHEAEAPKASPPGKAAKRVPTNAAEAPSKNFANNPFGALDQLGNSQS